MRTPIPKSIVLGLLLTAAAQVAFAATITVNTKVDDQVDADGRCTLREAVANVNAAADTTGGDCVAGTATGDTIAFDLKLPAKIKLRLGQLVIDQNVTISGPSAGVLSISGAGIDRVLYINAGATAASDLTIEHGVARAAVGGGIFNEGTLTLTRCTLKRNKATQAGAAIGNRGTATLIDCTLSRNTSQAGGAVSNVSVATMTLINSTVEHNRGHLVGGLGNAGVLNLTNCSLMGNRSLGGGGGAINNTGALTVTNCTFNRNKAWAGIGSPGGGAILNLNLGTVTLLNTILTDSGKGRNCGRGDPVTSRGHNLSSDNSCFAGSGTDLVVTDPQLTLLRHNGGPTRTMALCTSRGSPSHSCAGPSPAIDAGNDAVLGPPENLTTDQRGLPRRGAAHVDIGAFEAQ